MKAILDELTRFNDRKGLEDAMAELAKEESGVAKASSLITMMLQDICVGFKKLRSLTVTYLPWWSAEILRPVVHHMQQLRYAKFVCTANWFTILSEACGDTRHYSHHAEDLLNSSAHALPFASLNFSFLRLKFV